MNQKPTIARIAELQQFISDFARIERMPQLVDSGRPENDVEHSYGLALTCWFMHAKVAPELELSKILQYALAHDTVEIFAGDTFVFADDAVLATKSSREDDAITKLEADWLDFPDLPAFAKAYKHKADEEACFVYAVDKLLPVLMVNLGEKSAFWNRHKVTLAMQKAEKEPKIRVSPQVYPYYEALVAWMTDPDYFYQPQ